VKRWQWFGLFVVIAMLAAGFYAWQLTQKMNEPLHLPKNGYSYTLNPGTSIRALATDLSNKGVIENPWYLEVWARWLEPGEGVQAGEYHLAAGLTIPELLTLFRSGRAVQHRYTVVEGTRYRQLMQQFGVLAEKGLIETSANIGQLTQDFTEATGESHPEGWVFPDTYQFVRGSTDKSLILQAYQRMKKTLLETWDKRVEKLPIKTPYEALILASIVEKETGVEEERAKIAGVFVQRLRKGMRLQTDPTVIYGMGENYHGNITKADLRRDTPYNTYTRKGLPPTPIAMPGRASIDAVMHPDETGDLFFVASGGGRHYFSKTYKEHKQAVIKYLLKGKSKRYQGDK
jgi:UPF0755 protein